MDSERIKRLRGMRTSGRIDGVSHGQRLVSHFIKDAIKPPVVTNLVHLKDRSSKLLAHIVYGFNISKGPCVVDKIVGKKNTPEDPAQRHEYFQSPKSKDVFLLMATQNPTDPDHQIPNFYLVRDSRLTKYIEVHKNQEGSVLLPNEWNTYDAYRELKVAKG